MQRGISIGFLAILAVVGISCANTPVAMVEETSESATAILLDEPLAAKILLKEQTGHHDPATRAFLAQTQITNRTFEWLELECRTLFKNFEGATLETSPWKRIRLDPASRVTYTAPSLKPNATRFITQIRLAEKHSK